MGLFSQDEQSEFKERKSSSKKPRGLIKLPDKEQKKFNRLWEKVRLGMENEPKRKALREKKEERIRVKKWEQRFLREAKKAGFSETQAKFLLKQNRRFAPVNHSHWDGRIGPERF